MSVAALAAAVKVRIGDSRLVQMTNDDSTTTTVDDDVLNAACADAIGEFSRLVRVTADTDNVAHIPILILGVQYFLEDYKSRDGNIVSGRSKRFYSACKSFTSIVYAPMTTNSPLSPSTQRQGTRPDMDRNKKVWSPTGMSTGPAETWGDC